MSAADFAAVTGASEAEVAVRPSLPCFHAVSVAAIQLVQVVVE